MVIKGGCTNIWPQNSAICSYLHPSTYMGLQSTSDTPASTHERCEVIIGYEAHCVCVCVSDLGAAVAMVSGVGGVQGVVRFLQLSADRCLIDGTIDGLQPGAHGLHVHELGDLTQDCMRYSHRF